MEEFAEVDVEVLVHGEKAVKVTNGVMECWVPYKIIDDSSEIHEKTPVGVTGILVIPEWKAVNEGLV